MRNKNPGINLNDIPLDIFLEYYGKLDEDNDKRYTPKLSENLILEADIIELTNSDNDPYYFVDPLYEDTYLGTIVSDSLINNRMSTNISKHRESIRNAYTKTLGLLPDITNGNDIFLIKDDYYLPNELPRYTFWVKGTETVTEYSIVSDTKPNNVVVSKTYFIEGDLPDADSTVEISKNKKSFFNKTFSLKDIELDKVDNIRFKKEFTKYIKSVTPGTINIPKTKLLSNTGGYFDINEYPYRFEYQIELGSDYKGNSSTNTILNWMRSANLRYDFLNTEKGWAYVNTNKNVITFALSKIDFLREPKKIFNEEIISSVIQFGDESGLVVLLEFKRKDGTFYVQGSTKTLNLSTLTSTIYVFTVPYDVVFDEYENILDTLIVDNNGDTLLNTAQGLATLTDRIAGYVPPSTTQDESYSDAICLLKENGEERYLYKKYETVREIPSNLSVYKNSKLNHNVYSYYTLGNLIDHFGVDNIGFKEGYPGNSLERKFYKNSIYSLKNSIKNLIGNSAVTSLDATNAYNLAKSTSNVILSEMGIGGNNSERIQETILDEDVTVTKIVYEPFKKIDKTNIMSLYISKKSPKPPDDFRSIEEKLLTADDFPLSKYYSEYVILKLELSESGNGVTIPELESDEYVSDSTSLGIKLKSFELTPIYYKNMPTLENSHKIVYANNDLVLEIISTNPTGLVGSIMSAIADGDSNNKTVEMYNKYVKHYVAASSFNIPELDISKKQVICSNLNKKTIFEYIQKSIYGGDVIS